MPHITDDRSGNRADVADVPDIAACWAALRRAARAPDGLPTAGIRVRAFAASCRNVAGDPDPLPAAKTGTIGGRPATGFGDGGA